MRPSRPGEVICKCSVYRFPHKQFGGRCTLLRWVATFFSERHRVCDDCINYVEHECQCVTGVEQPTHCPELRSYISFEEIKLNGEARLMMERSTKSYK